MSDEKPPEYPTKEIPKPSETEILLQEIKVAITQQTKDATERFNRIDFKVDALTSDVSRAHVRIDELIFWKSGVNDRLKRNSERVSTTSMRVRENSEQDVSQDAAIAAILTRVADIETKTDAQTKVLVEIRDVAKGLASHPLAKKIALALGSAVLTYLATKGVHLP